MTLYQGLFYFFTVAAAIAAIGVLLSRNIYYSALLVIVCLLSVAALYVLAFAEFVAVTQILVYAGGILVVIIFGIMLTVKLGDVPLRINHSNIFTGFLISAPLLYLLIYLFLNFPVEAGPVSPIEKQPQTIQLIGINLMTEYVLIFEVAGLLLLIALVGAAVIASHKTRRA